VTGSSLGSAVRLARSFRFMMFHSPLLHLRNPKLSIWLLLTILKLLSEISWVRARCRAVQETETGRGFTEIYVCRYSSGRSGSSDRRRNQHVGPQMGTKSGGGCPACWDA